MELSELIQYRPLISGSRTPAHVVRLPNTTLYFSYNSLVAFVHPEVGLVCVKNQWGPTTGKHLNAIQPDKKKRVGQVQFEELLEGMKASLVAYRLRQGGE